MILYYRQEALASRPEQIGPRVLAHLQTRALSFQTCETHLISGQGLQNKHGGIMQEANRDLFPTDETISLFENVKPLLVNKLVDETFVKHNDASVAAKKIYHRLGRIATILIAISAIYTVADALVIPAYPRMNLVAAAIGLAAGLGIIIQIYILVTNQKREWLLNRYAAERLRAIKFQAFMLASTASDTGDLETKANAYVQEKITQLTNELNSDMAALDRFTPSQALQLVGTPNKAVNPDLEQSAKAAYQELRVVYQKRFADSELRRLNNQQRVINTSADLLYLLASCLVFGSLVVKVVSSGGAGPLGNWLDFLAVTTFIIGISKEILENAALGEQSKIRFEQYGKDLSEIERDLENPKVKFRSIIEHTERMVLDELDDFCRASQRINYRL